MNETLTLPEWIQKHAGIVTQNTSLIEKAVMFFDLLEVENLSSDCKINVKVSKTGDLSFNVSSINRAVEIKFSEEGTVMKILSIGHKAKTFNNPTIPNCRTAFFHVIGTRK